MIKVLMVVASLLLSSLAYAEIRLGALFSITGPASYLGLPEKQTLEMIVDEINAAGGIKGERIKLIIYDTKGEDAETRKKFMRLVQNDDVLAIIGPTRTGCSLSINELAESMKVPLFTCAASAKIVQPVKKYVFKSAQSDEHAVEKVYEYIKKSGKKKVAILTSQDGFGDTGRDALMSEAKNYGMTIVADERFKDSDKDMTSQLSKVSAKNPDAIICWGVGPAPAIIAKNYKQLGMKIPLFMSHGVASKKFIELAGDAADGIYLPAGRLTVADKLSDKDRFKSVLMAYKHKFENKYKSPVSAFGGYAYDSFLMFKYGFEKAGFNKEKMVEAVDGFRGVIAASGEFNMSANDHNGLSKDAFVMLKINKGDWDIAE